MVKGLVIGLRRVTETLPPRMFGNISFKQIAPGLKPGAIC
jgi:hypothetical protein